MSEPSLLAFLRVGDVAKADLEQRMREPERHYHTMQHLQLLWSRHLMYGAEFSVSDECNHLIAYAIAYHDAVYVAGAKDNEMRSAELWLEVADNISGLDAADRAWVAETIRATADHLGSAVTGANDRRAAARQWVLDLDLTPLGEAPEVFDANMTLLAAEMRLETAAAQRADLYAAIERFSAARPLYRSAPIAAAFEKPAQDNFRRHLRHDLRVAGATGKSSDRATDRRVT